ncbi:PIN domain-containing protein [Leptospira sp. GIMC2001]|uniref:PIN domain-containing protein n=1 Tax=Leptospira sp. GIMC2001 TaxID=1513297 RepID=UPI00234B7C97|nr:PIN domain-containing protein [Leptospira sp. GIMC2001]WCL50700.1 PIN domain-containing protein [Leptospira sp. GIMC2001]
MNRVLVDSSVWIDYFRGRNSHVEKIIDQLIELDIIFTNDLILAELFPLIIFNKLTKLKNCLEIVPKFQLNIQWDQIINYQILNIKSGINKVGIPDLIIAQNAIQNNSILFSLDRHFELMSKNLNLKLYS